VVPFDRFHTLYNTIIMMRRDWWRSFEFLAAAGGAVIGALVLESAKLAWAVSLPGWVVLPGLVVGLVGAFFVGRRTAGARRWSFPHETGVIVPKHRVSDARIEYFERAFSQDGEVFYVTIMSQSSMKNDFEECLKTARHGTKIRVLTWYSANRDVVETFRLHLRENDDAPEKTFSQVGESADEWRRIKRDFPNLNMAIKVYESFPTMQGTIVKDKWALIELLPYHTGTKHRPGLLVTQQEAPQTLHLLWEKFEELFDTRAKPLTDIWPPPAGHSRARNPGTPSS